MVIAVYLFLLLYLICCRPSFCNGIRDGSYLSRERTCTINAFMIVSVFFMHATGFIIAGANGQILPLEGVDGLFTKCIHKISELVVSCFFLFSGYGIMESVNRKGASYLSGFWKTRFWKVLYQFELGILCYYVLALAWGRTFSVEQTILGFLGWKSFGGPIWFITVTLLLYIAAYAGLRCSGWKRWCVLWGLSALLYVFLYVSKSPGGWYWYATLFCFPAGMVLSCYRSKLELMIERVRIPAPFLGILMAGAAYIAPNEGIFFHPLVYNLKSVIFAYGVALACSCVRFERSPRLMMWIGGNALFSFFFYHTLVYRLVFRYSPVPLSAEVFLAVSLLLSLLVSWLLLYVYSFMEKKLFRF